MTNLKNSTETARCAVADTTRLVTRDELARALCVSFYRRGHIYDATLAQVIAARWREWREQADDLLKEFAVFPRQGARP